MPFYDYECPSCEHQVELMHSMRETPRHACPKCKTRMGRVILTAPAVRGDLDDFSTENSGKGRWNPQLSTYVTSVKDTIAKGAARGLRPMG